MGNAPELQKSWSLLLPSEGSETIPVTVPGLISMNSMNLSETLIFRSSDLRRSQALLEWMPSILGRFWMLIGLLLEGLWSRRGFGVAAVVSTMLEKEEPISCACQLK